MQDILDSRLTRSWNCSWINRAKGKISTKFCAKYPWNQTPLTHYKSYYWDLKFHGEVNFVLILRTIKYENAVTKGEDIPCRHICVRLQRKRDSNLSNFASYCFSLYQSFMFIHNLLLIFLRKSVLKPEQQSAYTHPLDEPHLFDYSRFYLFSLVVILNNSKMLSILDHWYYRVISIALLNLQIFKLLVLLIKIAGTNCNGLVNRFSLAGLWKVYVHGLIPLEGRLSPITNPTVACTSQC